MSIKDRSVRIDSYGQTAINVLMKISLLIRMSYHMDLCPPSPPGLCCVLTCERPLSAGPCDLPWALRLGTHSPRGVSRTSSHSTCLPRPPSAGPPGRFARGECPPRCWACLLCQERRAWCVQHVGTDVAVPARANSWPEQRLPRWSPRPALLPQRGRRRRRCGT